jgi:hypothetical protein
MKTKSIITIGLAALLAATKFGTSPHAMENAVRLAGGTVAGGVGEILNDSHQGHRAQS